MMSAPNVDGIEKSEQTNHHTPINFATNRFQSATDVFRNILYQLIRPEIYPRLTGKL